MRVHSYARTRRDASRPTQSTHKNGDQFFPATRRRPRDRRNRSPRSRERPGEGSLGRRARKVHRRAGFPSDTLCIPAGWPPFYFTPTYHFTCPTRRAFSYHEAATTHISPFARTLAHLPSPLGARCLRARAPLPAAILVPTFRRRATLGATFLVLSRARR